MEGFGIHDERSVNLATDLSFSKITIARAAKKRDRPLVSCFFFFYYKPVNEHTNHLMVNNRRRAWTLKTLETLHVRFRLLEVRNIRINDKSGKLGRYNANYNYL